MSFDSLYTKLNPEQKQAVDTIEGPVIVVAGPGTGKTHVLTLRIANILRIADTEPRNILALTFTDSASKTMRTRLTDLIGSPARNVRIETFHSLAESIISEYPEFFPFERSAKPLTQVEQFEIVRHLLSDLDFSFLRTPGSKYHYARDIVSALGTLKRENITVGNFKQIVADEAAWFEGAKSEMKKTELLKWQLLVGKHQELAQIYSGYQLALRSRARYDFDDMLLETHAALKANNLLLASLQEQFQYVLVDEYQDTNGVQNAIIDLISSFWEEPNLFVVGDPNQTIFRFQGAILENLLGFLERYPKAKVITLSSGYRSNQEIYSSSHGIILPTLSDSKHALVETLKLPLKASHSRGKISLNITATDSDELLWLVQEIRGLIKKGESAEEIAVLFKRNAEGTLLADLLLRAGIPFHIERDINILDDPQLNQFFSLLRLIHTLRSADENRLLFDVLSFDWFQVGGELPSLTLLKLIRSFATQRTFISPFDFLSQPFGELKKMILLKQLSPEEHKVIEAQIRTLSSWESQERKHTFPVFAELVAKESGFLPSLVQSKNQESVANFITLMKELNKLAVGPFRLEHFLAYLATMSEQDLSLSRSQNHSSAGVTLATIHKAKGREWKHVFVPFFREKYWGKARKKPGLTLPEAVLTHAPASSNEEADERRLLFVALTRSKQDLHLSMAETLRDGERTVEALPSPYLTELPSLTPVKPDIDPSLQSLFIETVPVKEVDRETKAWLTELVADFPISASSLNAYLEDPKAFFERYILKLPEASLPHLAFGNAIHRTLEWYYRSYTEDHIHPPLTRAIKIFDEVISQEILTDQDRKIRTNQGHKVLTEYLTAQNSNYPEVIATEESFGWRRGKIHMDGVELTGKIDRIDLVDAGVKQLRVMDYKTGKPKGPGDIEGSTKGAGLTPREEKLPPGIRGRLKRQLLFYKLLLSLDPKYHQFQTLEGIFEFVEPQKGEFISRKVALLESDVEDLKELIRTVSREIRDLKFLEAI